MVRFADDFVMMFQHEEEAIKTYEALKARLAKFGLQLAEDKSRVLPFGRNSNTKDTFDFLGFIHYNGKTKSCKYTIGHKISQKKKKVFKAKLKAWIKSNRNLDLKTFLQTLDRKLIGRNNYYGIRGAFSEVKLLYEHAKFVTYKWLNRRSQRKSFTYETFQKIWDKTVRKPYVHVNIWAVGGIVYNSR